MLRVSLPRTRAPWSSTLRFVSERTDSRKSISILDHQHLLEDIPLEDVRAFCFISHVDHGKSSLSARMLELAGNLGPELQKLAWDAAESGGSTSTSASKEKIELLDSLAVEQQRGITVKATTASMLYRHPSAVGPHGVLLVNLYDTPGHADFGLEVSRSLSFVQGAVLLLDATQGIQAQTWSVYDKVKSLPQPPELMMALTKVDLESAQPVHVALSACEWLNWDDPDTIIHTSARNRIGIRDLLDTVCARVPPPRALEDDDESILRVQVVDSWYDSRGVNCLVQVLSGALKENERISILQPDVQNSQSLTSYSVQEVGIVVPQPRRTGKLRRGQLGYVRFGLRDPRQALPGTILVWSTQVGKPMILPQIPRASGRGSVLYASVHPQDADGFDELKNAVERLALNDTGLELQATSSIGAGEGGGPFLAPGLRVGFQGLLHVEVFQQRLLDDFGVQAVVTPPKVPYTVTFLPSKNTAIKEAYSTVVEDLADWPSPGTRYRVEEPMVTVRLIARVTDAGSVMELINKKRGSKLETKAIDEEKWLFTAQMPWAECVTDFHDQLKNLTAGYGSMDVSGGVPDLKEADLCKVDIMLNGEVVDPLAFVCHRDVAQSEARIVCKKLQEVLPRQQFVTVIQATENGKIIASERIRAFRKDVLTKSGKTVGGGDMTRKMKLLEKQKEGKKKMQQSGKVTLTQDAFNSVISRS